MLQIVKDNTILDGLEFIEAFATNTRLMGVIGVVVELKDFTGINIKQLYHLDYESYGIDGFKEFKNIDDTDFRRELYKTIGGLGGTLERINFEEFIYLLKCAYDVQRCEMEEVDFLLQKYPKFINNNLSLEYDNQIRLLNKLSGDSLNDNEIIHYFMMRYLSCDFEALKHLVEDMEILKECITPATLIKNEIKVLDYYVDSVLYGVTSLMDCENHYKILNASLELSKTDKKVLCYDIMNELDIAPIEAARRINKKEYLALYTLKKDGFRYLFDYKKPYMMLNIHPNGSTYIEFNSNNNHVKEDTYYLSGDVYAVYYLTDSNQLLVSTFEQQNLDEIDEFFYSTSLSEYVELEGFYDAESSLIYEFINSEYDNFYDFLDRR